MINQSAPDPGEYPIRQIMYDHREEIRRMPSLSDTQRSAAMMISMCRTAELGFNASICPNCGIQLHYASCNNRNCPCCQWPSQQSWIKQRENEVIPDIPYYHIILTVPHELNPLIRLNEKLLLGSLFSCSSQAVIDLSRSCSRNCISSAYLAAESSPALPHPYDCIRRRAERIRPVHYSK